jgi:ABC-type spermidine/putrescine transport system permease subunit I
MTPRHATARNDIGLTALLLLGAVMLLPIALTIWLSLRDPAGGALTATAWPVVVTSAEALRALAYSLSMGAAVALLGGAVGLPLAHVIAVRGGGPGRWILALALLLWLLDPGIRVLAWTEVLKRGVLLDLLPDAVRSSNAAELLARLHGWLPFCILLQALALRAAPMRQMMAARECGAGSLRIFRQLVWPACRRRILLAGAIVFAGASGGFLEPRLLGSGRLEQATEWLQRAMESEVGWPYAATMLLLLMALALLPLALLMLPGRRR